MAEQEKITDPELKQPDQVRDHAAGRNNDGNKLALEAWSNSPGSGNANQGKLELTLAAAHKQAGQRPHRSRPSESDEDDVTEDDEEEEHEKNHNHGNDDHKPSKSERIAIATPEEAAAGLPNLKLFFGALHGHSVYSDGLCKPSELYPGAKAQGMDFATITEHSHMTARAGVKPSNPRFEEQAKVPIVAAAPQLYNATIHDAEAATENGKFVGLYGVELGTIGKPGQDAIAGVNHINVFQMKEFIESVKGGKTPRRSMETGHVPEEEQFSKPEVFKVPDGDHKKLVEWLEQHKDATGGRPVIQLNHPRWSQDENANLEDDVRGRDYGQKAFENQDEWLEKFGKFASQLEILSGEALKEEQSGDFKSQHIHAHDFAGYIDKGLHISPTFGRDSHYCDLGGTPAATGILAENLDPKSLMDAMRERRTIATTAKDALAGYMVMNDKFVMGSVVDENQAENVHITVTVAGDIKPDAKYTAILWADPNIGDGELAEKEQTVHISGADLLESHNQIKFEDVTHIAGNKAAYWVEVQRKADDEDHQPNRMWTAPVWVEPKA